MAKSKSKRPVHHNNPHPEPHGPPKQKETPKAMFAAIVVGIVVIIGGFALSRSGSFSGGDAIKPAQPAPQAAVNPSKTKATQPEREPAKRTRGLVSSLPSDADAFGGDAARAKTFQELQAKVNNPQNLRQVQKEVDDFATSVGTGAGAAEVAAMQAFVHLGIRDTATATRVLDTALAGDPGAVKQTLEALRLQAQLDTVPREQTPPPELIDSLARMAEDATEPLVQAAALYHLGRAQKRSGQTEAALASWQEVVKSHPDSDHAPAALYDIGRTWEESGDGEKALAAFDALSEDYRGSPQATGAAKSAGMLRVVGKPAVDIDAEQWLNGKPMTFGEDLKGKVVLLLFWATWCPHCRKEMPHMIETWKTYHDQGLEIIGVTNLDKKQELGQVESYVQEQAVPFPILLQNGRKGSQYYAVSGIPAAALVDRQGKVRWRNHPASGLDEILKKVLAESP